MRKTCIIISGPTAVGKTDIAHRLALEYKTEIISADSRQCYKELDIGVAKPTRQQLDTVPHHFINSHSVHEAVNAATFEAYALEKATDIFQNRDILVMVGGTGLYIKTFCEGIDEVPVIFPGIREDLVRNYETNGIAWLQEQLLAEDPVWYQQGENKNPQRMLRALEVRRSTGKSILSFQLDSKLQRSFNVIHITLELPRPVLYGRINTRVDEMMSAGLLQEVSDLLQYKNLNALNTVGYKELFSHLSGEMSLEEAVELVKQHTRQYAKRQLTWFKKMPGVTWCAPGIEPVSRLVHEKLLKINS